MVPYPQGSSRTPTIILIDVVIATSFFNHILPVYKQLDMFTSVLLQMRICLFIKKQG